MPTVSSVFESIIPYVCGSSFKEVLFFQTTSKLENKKMSVKTSENRIASASRKTALGMFSVSAPGQAVEASLKNLHYCRTTSKELKE